MRKKSHILLTRYLATDILEMPEANSHIVSFCYGSIVPDIRPSFLVKKHEFYGTYGELVEKIQYLTMSSEAELSDRDYWVKFGEILHYIADYFTYPHNVNYPGGFNDHNKYEKELKNTLKKMLLNGEMKNHRYYSFNFESVMDLAEFIEECHEDYMENERNVESDIQYILMVTSIVTRNIYLLCNRSFATGRVAVAGV